MKFRIRHADTIVGAFIVFALVLLGTSLVFAGANQRWFSRNYHFVSLFSSGAGISPGTAIQLKGFQIGKIEAIHLNTENMVDVKFYIYDTYIDKVKENSILELATSPIGLGSQLLLHPGKSENIAKENSLIPNLESEDAKELVDAGLVDVGIKDDTITRLLSNVNPLLETTTKTIANVNKTVTELNKALQGQTDTPLGRIVDNADNTIDKISSSVSNANDLMGSLKSDLPQILSKVDEVMLSIKVITKNLEGTSLAFKDPTGIVTKLLDPKGSLKSFLDDDNKLYDKVNIMINDVKKTLENIQKLSEGLKSEVPKISTIITEGKTTLEKAQDVLEGLKNNPLLKGGIPERKNQESLYDSMREEEF